MKDLMHSKQYLLVIDVVQASLDLVHSFYDRQNAAL